MALPNKASHRKKWTLKEYANIPGVYRVTLSQMVQKYIGAVVGTHVTCEKPVVMVKKELIQDNLELHEESSEFLAFKSIILAYPRDIMLLVYVPNEESEQDEFLISVTEKSTDFVSKLMQKQLKKQQEALNSAIKKSVKQKWKSYGSGNEIKETFMKTNRNLLEVQIESISPFPDCKIHLSSRFVDDVKDGYTDLMAPGDDRFEIINQNRIDASIQVSPPMRFNESQTDVAFPQDISSQYEYTLGEDLMLKGHEIEAFKTFIKDNMSSLSDHLTFAKYIHLYSRDYNDLSSKCRNQWHKTKKNVLKVTQPFCTFLDVILCKDKMVSSSSMHYQMKSLIGAAYVKMCPQLSFGPNYKEDDKLTSVYDRNVVLIWSLEDCMNPKLILESPFQVTAIRFCPTEENILIGGCENGQIIIWDIKSALDRIGKTTIINSNQEKYKNILISFMHWMLKVGHKNIVRPTAISDPRYSHQSIIVDIKWISPLAEVTRTGKLLKCKEEETSLQFMSISRDGSLNIWDLRKPPSRYGVKSKSQKNFKRKRKLPSHLQAVTSPYKIYHMTLKPIYKVLVPQEQKSSQMAGIVSFVRHESKIIFKKSNKNESSGKIDHPKPHPIEDEDDLKTNFFFGTVDGKFMYAKFEGLDFDTGSAVNAKTASIEMDCRVHDGSVISIDFTLDKRIGISVGGKIFALWMKEYPGKPIFWRKSKRNFTCGVFRCSKQSEIRLCCDNGYVELWAPAVDSKKNVSLECISAWPVTNSTTFEKDGAIIFSIVDSFGNYEMYRTHNILDSSSDQLYLFLKREATRKVLFNEWQTNWNAKHEEEIIKKHIKESKIYNLPQEIPVDAGGDKPPETSKKKSYIEYEIERRNKLEMDNINIMITEKKRLNLSELHKQRKPLTILEKETEKKRRKQREKIRLSQQIFDDKVAMLFSSAFDLKQDPPVDPYVGGNPIESKISCYQEFVRVEKSVKFIPERREPNKFNLRNILRVVNERKKTSSRTRLDDVHRMRRMNIIQEKLEIEERTQQYRDNEVNFNRSTSTITPENPQQSF